ncbi:hypothetical protein D3C76_1434580 [compost metagenome]
MQYARMGLRTGCAAQPDRTRQSLEVMQAEVQAFAVLVAPAHQGQHWAALGLHQRQLPHRQLVAQIAVA